MKKKILALLPMVIFIVIVLFHFLPEGGDIRPVRREIGQSIRFTTEEIESAMEKAEQHFKKEFEGCILFNITYNESFSDKFASEWAESYGSEEAIVLTSRFYVDASGGDGSFNPESYYDNWQWILTRNAGEAWQLQTWGYG